jgi:hypothetical protein
MSIYNITSDQYVLLDLIGTVFAAAAIAANLTAILSTMHVRLAWRLGIAVIIGAWIGIVVAIASTGGLANQTIRLMMFALPLAAVGLFALASPPVRSALLSIPMPILIGVNAARIFGFLFLLLADAGGLSGPFPTWAGWGDIIAGTLAIPIAWLAARPYARKLAIILGWNWFGALDLVNAVALALLSTNGSRFQLIHAGVGPAAMTSLPWVLAPTFLVPFYFVCHAIVFAQLRQRGATSRFGQQARKRIELPARATTLSAASSIRSSRG